MAGTISYSMSQQFGLDGKPLSGGKLYFYQAGTTNPQSAYYDYGLTIPAPNPLECDSTGRLPQFFLADGFIKVRLEDKNGVVIPGGTADSILVIGPSSGEGGGGGGVDPTTVKRTGEMFLYYGSGNIDGAVPVNGKTIGSATSGATQLAHAGVEALFKHLWIEDSSLVVSTGRGASAQADWDANKTIALPDPRTCAIVVQDGLGNTKIGRLTEAVFGADPSNLGAIGGAQSRPIAEANLPAIKPTLNVTNPDITFNYDDTYADGYSPTNAVGVASEEAGGAPDVWSHTHSKSKTITPNASVTFANNLGSGEDLATVQPSFCVPLYIKL